MLFSASPWRGIFTPFLEAFLTSDPCRLIILCLPSASSLLPCGTVNSMRGAPWLTPDLEVGGPLPLAMTSLPNHLVTTVTFLPLRIVVKLQAVRLELEAVVPSRPHSCLRSAGAAALCRPAAESFLECSVSFCPKGRVSKAPVHFRPIHVWGCG